jgi:hypothetical protein
LVTLVRESRFVSFGSMKKYPVFCPLSFGLRTDSL